MSEQLQRRQGLAVAFSGKVDDDVEEFLELAEVNFMMYEESIPAERRPRVKLCYLGSLLTGEARKWWLSLETNKKDMWEHATDAIKVKYGRESQATRNAVEWHYAYTNLCNLSQNDLSNGEYVLHAENICNHLGESYNQTVALKFMQGIKDPITRKLVHGILENNHNFSDVTLAFLKATRGETSSKTQNQVEIQEKAAMDLQASMVKMMLDNSREVVRMVTTALSGLGNQQQDQYQHQYQSGVPIDIHGPQYQASSSKPGQQYVPTCYSCGQQGHYRYECPS